MLEPVSVALKFGFLAVPYLFLLWVRAARCATCAASPAPTTSVPARARRPTRPACTRRPRAPPNASLEPRLIVERAPGHTPGMEHDIGDGAVMGRGDRAEIRLDDPFASAQHARMIRQGGVVVFEDLGSTNGTYLNEELLKSDAAARRRLHPHRRVRVHVHVEVTRAMLRVAERQQTDTGRQRHANEDAYFARSPLFAVADGWAVRRPVRSRRRWRWRRSSRASRRPGCCRSSVSRRSSRGQHPDPCAVAVRRGCGRDGDDVDRCLRRRRTPRPGPRR